MNGDGERRAHLFRARFPVKNMSLTVERNAERSTMKNVEQFVREAQENSAHSARFQRLIMVIIFIEGIST